MPKPELRYYGNITDKLFIGNNDWEVMKPFLPKTE
jgi:hypothetical protein